MPISEIAVAIVALVLAVVAARIRGRPVAEGRGWRIFALIVVSVAVGAAFGLVSRRHGPTHTAPPPAAAPPPAPAP